MTTKLLFLIFAAATILLIVVPAAHAYAVTQSQHTCIQKAVNNATDQIHPLQYTLGYFLDIDNITIKDVENCLK